MLPVYYDWPEISKVLICGYHPQIFWFDYYVVHNNYKLQVGIKIGSRNINNFRYVDDATLMAESWVTKEPIDEGEGGEWKSWLKKKKKNN